MYISLRDHTKEELQTALAIEKKITDKLPARNIFGDDNLISVKILEMAIAYFDFGGFDAEITEEADEWDDSSFGDEEFHNSAAYMFLDGDKEVFFESYRDQFGEDYTAEAAEEAGYKVCSKLCGECPFSSKSAKGWLADYEVKDFMNFMTHEILFPCHMQMGEDDLSPEAVNEKVRNGELTLCRGYVESMRKSCKTPRDEKLAKIVAEIEVSEQSMSIFEFAKHHETNPVAG